jgi:HTH-type transcriptional regulator / antitoxin HipB
MNDFPVRNPDQLPTMLQSLRKAAGLTQADVALRMGITQQTVSTFERNADSLTAARLMKLLNIYGAGLVFRTQGQPAPAPLSAQEPQGW